MKFVEYPEFETDQESDEWFNQDMVGFVDHNVYDTLESVDMILNHFGLEIILYGEDPEAPFSIVPINETIN